MESEKQVRRLEKQLLEMKSKEFDYKFRLETLSRKLQKSTELNRALVTQKEQTDIELMYKSLLTDQKAESKLEI
jgi:hypothetical protein